MSSLTTVLIGLVSIVLLGGLAAGASVLARRHRPIVDGIHALRDNHARNPVVGPLRAGCASMEIGAWLDAEGRLQVGSDRRNRDAGNAVGPLVLRELALRAAANGGRVRPDQAKSFMLMIDILETEPATQARAYRALERALRAYPGLFTRVVDGGLRLGAVTVALIGSGTPRHAVAAEHDRRVFCDGSFGDVGAWGTPVELVPVVSEHWSWRFGWDGVDDVPLQERVLLRQLVAAAHDDGRQVRIFGIPERPAKVREAYWREISGAGVDVISTARPRRLARFLSDATTVVRAVPQARDAVEPEVRVRVGSAR